MREVTYYEADDGTQFKDECECLEYEWRLDVESKGHMYALLNSKRVLLDNNKTNSYDDCFFIFLKNSNSAKALCRVWNEDILGSYCPDFISDYANATPGLWAYDEDNDSWYHVGVRISELQDMADECMEAINRG